MRLIGMWMMLALAGTASAAPVTSAASQVATVATAAEPRSYSAAPLKGTWTDESGTKYTFKGGSTPKLSKIVDSDGEKFTVLWYGWNDGNYQYVYRVPSTGYIVVITITGLGDNEAETNWVNDHEASGTERLFRD